MATAETNKSPSACCHLQIGKVIAMVLGAMDREPLAPGSVPFKPMFGSQLDKEKEDRRSDEDHLLFPRPFSLVHGTSGSEKLILGIVLDIHHTIRREAASYLSPLPLDHTSCIPNVPCCTQCFTRSQRKEAARDGRNTMGRKARGFQKRRSCACPFFSGAWHGHVRRAL